MPWEEQMKTIVAFQYFAGAAVTVEREWRTSHAAFLYISKLDNSRHSKNLIEGPWVEKKIQNMPPNCKKLCAAYLWVQASRIIWKLCFSFAIEVVISFQKSSEMALLCVKEKMEMIAFWPKEEVINGLLSLLADHLKPRNIRKIVFLPLSQCVYYTFQKKRQENRCSILVDYTSCNRFWPNNAVKGKKEEKHPRKKREFLDEHGEWNPKIPQPVCVYT